MSNWNHPEWLKVPLNLNIQCHDYLPPGTILVSPDIWKLLQEQFAAKEKDREFLRRLGILPDLPESPGNRFPKNK